MLKPAMLYSWMKSRGGGPGYGLGLTRDCWQATPVSFAVTLAQAGASDHRSPAALLHHGSPGRVTLLLLVVPENKPASHIKSTQLHDPQARGTACCHLPPCPSRPHTRRARPSAAEVPGRPPTLCINRSVRIIQTAVPPTPPACHLRLRCCAHMRPPLQPPLTAVEYRTSRTSP